MHRTILSALMALAIAGCTLTGGGDEVAPLETEAIAVTSLGGGAEGVAPAQGEAARVVAAEPEPSEPEPAPEVPPEVVAPLSPAAIACGRQGGRFVSVAKGAGNACVRTTRDAGKACRRETDCEGRCLARSGTCSPIDPLFGCNEILQANGTRVTLCLD